MGKKTLALAFIVIIAISFGSLAEQVAAQAYPTKPIQLVAAGSPSGSVDIVARMIEQTFAPKKCWISHSYSRIRLRGAGIRVQLTSWNKRETGIFYA